MQRCGGRAGQWVEKCERSVAGQVEVRTCTYWICERAVAPGRSVAGPNLVLSSSWRRQWQRPRSSTSMLSAAVVVIRPIEAANVREGARAGWTNSPQWLAARARQLEAKFVSLHLSIDACAADTYWLSVRSKLAAAGAQRRSPSCRRQLSVVGARMHGVGGWCEGARQCSRLHPQPASNAHFHHSDQCLSAA